MCIITKILITWIICLIPLAVYGMWESDREATDVVKRKPFRYKLTSIWLLVFTGILIARVWIDPPVF